MTDDLAPLGGRYRLVEKIATGGMGEVWRAEDETLDRAVAVKLLRRDRSAGGEQDEVARSRLRAEARYAAALRSRGIAQVYDLGEEDDLVYLVMELVTGRSLAQVLAERGALTPVEAMDLVAQTARALHVAHTAGIVHRDVKPANLMITSDGTVKVMDFGIARTTDADAVHLTASGMVMGTAQYVAPERAAGRELTPAADLYSLGVVTYLCLTGELPFDGDNALEIALKHVREEPPELVGMPPRVRDLVASLLAKEPADRPASALALATEASAIRRTLGGSPTTTGELAQLMAGDEPATTEQVVRLRPTPDRRPNPATRPVLLPGGRSAGGDGTDGDPGEEDEPDHRSVLFLSSMALGILLLGMIIVAALWRMPHGSGSLNGNTAVPNVNNTQSEGPTPSVSTSASPAAVPQSPLATASPTHLSTSPTPQPSISGSPSSTPKPTASSAPSVSETPTPTPSTPTTPTQDPSPGPSGTPPAELGSDSKV